MKIFLKNYTKYFFLFIFFLFFNIFVISLCNDENWNYGFAYNIYKGLVPYKDFNMIITPFFSFFMSLFFHFFGSNILMFEIIQSIILTVLCYVIFNKYGSRGWLAIVFFFLPTVITFPSYNTFLLFLYVFLIYFEDKHNKNNYLIGFILGIAVLTKQSVGLCLLLPSIYYIKNRKIIFQRFVGFIIPILIFIIFLFISNSYNQFIDLCLLGLFDFTENTNGVNLYFILLLVIIFILLYFIRKNPRDINNYYLLSFSSIVLPLFDLYHFQIFFVAFVLFLIPKIKNDFLNYPLFAGCIILGLFMVSLYYDLKKYNYVYPNDINNFNYKFINGEEVKFINLVNQYMIEHNDSEFVFLCSDAYFFKLTNNIEINHHDIVNYGNWGYDGSRKLLNSIKNIDNAIFVLNMDEIQQRGNQTDKNVVRYVLENGTKVHTIQIYDFYILEK